MTWTALLLTLVLPLSPSTDPVGVWPLQPTPSVVRGFDAPDSPYGAGHRGVDLLGRPGQPVHAALAGTVAFAGSLAGRGVVVVDHGATRTTYEPVSTTSAVGDPVGRGAVIGALELVGSHCFPRACLHWGWIEGETYLDPLRLVGVMPVRLLPLSGGPVPAADPVPTRRSRPRPSAARPARPPTTHPLARVRQALGWACW